MKPKYRGLTTIELLTVLAIIMMLMGILIPTLTTVRKNAKRIQQKAEFNTIEMALTAFKGDYGSYPSSSSENSDYSGSQKLAEALLGRDLMGFNPATNWDATDDKYLLPGDLASDADLEGRRDLYLDLSNSRVFLLGDLYNTVVDLERDTYVLCDVFNAKRVSLGGKTYNAGTPILYYRADTSKKRIDRTEVLSDRIYNADDNVALTTLMPSIMSNETVYHPLGVNTGRGDRSDYHNFYEFIRDWRVTTRAWPQRADSYILISAGPDGLYGTEDDVTNFDK